jgi:hypothetical protein
MNAHERERFVVEKRKDEGKAITAKSKLNYLSLP